MVRRGGSGRCGEPLELPIGPLQRILAGCSGAMDFVRGACLASSDCSLS